jgi:hypothetical protein
LETSASSVPYPAAPQRAEVRANGRGGDEPQGLKTWVDLPAMLVARYGAALVAV